MSIGLQTIEEKKESNRKGFGEGMLALGERNKDIVVLSADLKESTFMHLFASKFPQRYIEVGVAEQNLVTVASGLSAIGKIPIVSSYSIFSPGRNWEQIRTTICYNNRKVVIVGSHTGLSVGPDGGSHQMLEDIALMRVLPNMTVLSPVDSFDAHEIALNIEKINGPIYIRLARNETPLIKDKEIPWQFNKARYWIQSDTKKPDVAIVATGPILFEALKATFELQKQGINASLLEIHTIKPLDEDALWKLAGLTGAVVTVEDHQISGGLGGAVAECLSRHRPVPIEFIGVKDKFGQSGTPEELYAYYGLDKEHIIKAVKKVMARK